MKEGGGERWGVEEEPGALGDVTRDEDGDTMRTCSCDPAVARHGVFVELHQAFSAVLPIHL